MMPIFISFFPVELNYNMYFMVCTPCIVKKKNDETLIPTLARRLQIYKICIKSKPSVTCFPTKTDRTAPGSRTVGLMKNRTVEQTAGEKNMSFKITVFQRS